MSGKLIVIGAGGHGVVVAEAAVAANEWREVVFLDDHKPAENRVNGLRLEGSIDTLNSVVEADDEVLVAIGDNQIRIELHKELVASGNTMATVIHPSATVSPTATIGVGTVVLAGVVVNARADVGSAVILNTASCVDHDCRLADGVHISPGANLTGNVCVGTCAWIGAGAVAIPSTRIGSYATVGAGSTVIRNIDDRAVVAGSPARSIHQGKNAK